MKLEGDWVIMASPHFLRITLDFCSAPFKVFVLQSGPKRKFSFFCPTVKVGGIIFAVVFLIFEGIVYLTPETSLVYHPGIYFSMVLYSVSPSR